MSFWAGEKDRENQFVVHKRFLSQDRIKKYKDEFLGGKKDRIK